MNSTTQPTALITGASSGIGLELARLFARDGYHLVLTARNQSRMETLAQELRQARPIDITIIPADLAQPGTPAAIASRLQALGIQVDVLVNNAGTQVYAPFAEADGRQLSEMLQVNVSALMELTHLLLPGMLQRRRGKILNLGSTGSFAPGPMNAVYCASKAFVLSFSEAIAAELDGSGVSVTALCPGATHTDFARRHGIEDIRLFQNAMPADQVAAIGYRALQRGQRVVVSGATNQLQVVFFKLAGLFMPLLSNRILMQMAEYFIGRVQKSSQI